VFVADHQIIAVEDFTPVFGATSTRAGESADSSIGAATAELIQRGTRAGVKGGEGGARLPGDDVFEVLAEASTPEGSRGEPSGVPAADLPQGATAPSPQ
jgi:hypothetical protein